MNDTLKTILDRRSCKNYKDQEVEIELIEKIVEAGTYAPSGMGRQSPIILAITNKQLRDEISKLNADVMGATKDPFYGAPVVLVVLGNKAIPTYIYDGSVVMENMMLAASSLGLGSCWIHRAKEVFDSPRGKEILKSLGIEGDYEGIGNCIVGYANSLNPDKPRKEDYIYWVK